MAEITSEKRTKLLAIRERLIDVYLEEADPENWTTKESAEAAAEELMVSGGTAKEALAIKACWKGQRYWEKKNANQTAVMILKLDQILEPAAEQGGIEDEPATEKEISKYEKQASKRLARSRPDLRKIEGGKR